MLGICSLSRGRFPRRAAELAAGCLLLVIGEALAEPSDDPPRRVLSLNGSWEITEGAGDEPPGRFSRRIPVPGVVDMAEPPFPGVGSNTEFADEFGQKFKMISDPRYRAFWYRRTFSIDQELPPVAILKIAKAKYGTRVWLNGVDLGEHPACFTPSYFNVASHLKGRDLTNELIVRVGADPLTLGDRAANGHDFEKRSYLAGIYDDVELILTGSVYVVNVQVVPDVERGRAHVVAELHNSRSRAVTTDVSFEIHPYETSETAGRSRVSGVTIGPGLTRTIETRIAIDDCLLWSPEEPNLYQLETRTEADHLSTRFGMRSFHFDPTTTIGVLNGDPYFLRGSNVCYFRFEEDPLRGNKPWDEAWVRKLHRRFKSLHLNALRYCIGFPPEMWYRIADEEGLIIQDEFPIWTLDESGVTPVAATTLSGEYRDWMRSHWNHASVLIWDAQNESRTDTTRQAIAAVRDLDISNRPWDNGWGKPHEPADVLEDHPYQFSRSMSVTSWNPKLQPLPTIEAVVDRYAALEPAGARPRIVNEYAWLWLQRNGEPTTLTRAGYSSELPLAGAAERREFYALRLAAMTEALRSSRKTAGVLHFCGLGHSWDGCATSDNFIDLETLSFEPVFFETMRDAFAPVGLMLRVPGNCTADQVADVEVVVFNDLGMPWTGEVVVSLEGHSDAVSRPVTVAPYGRAEMHFSYPLPDVLGERVMRAELRRPDSRSVRSRRPINVAP